MFTIISPLYWLWRIPKVNFGAPGLLKVTWKLNNWFFMIYCKYDEYHFCTVCSRSWFLGCVTWHCISTCHTIHWTARFKNTGIRYLVRSRTWGLTTTNQMKMSPFIFMKITFWRSSWKPPILLLDDILTMGADGFWLLTVLHSMGSTE